MRQKKKQADKVAIALVLCFCVVAIASVFTVKSGIDKLGNISQPGIDIAEKQKTQSSEQDVIQPVPTVDSKTGEGTAPEKSRTAAYAAPVKGDVILDYAKDMPIYSKTLDQYMVHEGLDIASDLDSQVKAVEAGTVTDVYTDDKYGATVTINHGNGLISVYSNLSTAKLVEEGDVVTKGQVIGGVGESALFEILDVPHLHFEMHKGGETVNPKDYISF